MYIVVNLLAIKALTVTHVRVHTHYSEIWTPHLNRCLAQVQMAWNADTILFDKMGGFFGLTSTWTVHTCVCFIMPVLACLSLKIVSHYCLIEQLDIIVALVCIVQCMYILAWLAFLVNMQQSRVFEDVFIAINNMSCLPAIHQQLLNVNADTSILWATSNSPCIVCIREAPLH